MKNLPNEINWLVLDATLKGEWEREASRIASKACGTSFSFLRWRIRKMNIAAMNFPRKGLGMPLVKY